MGARAEDRETLHRLRDEMAEAGREREAEALDAVLGEELFLKLRKRWYTPAEVARRMGVSRQTVVKDAASGEKLVTIRASTFARGDGGFGGPTEGQPEPHEVPKRAPDMSVDITTRPNQ